jgi:hypothetical protein
MTKVNKKTKRVFEMFARKVIRDSINNLSRQDHIDTGKLASALAYDLFVYRSGALELKFTMPLYGMFQDKGVKGSQSGRRAYKSPYRFKGKNIKEDVIEAWIKRKGLQGRDKKGRFIKRETFAYLIGRKIALFGLPATRFFSNAFRLHFRQMPREVIRSYATDVADFLRFTTKDIMTDGGTIS